MRNALGGKIADGYGGCGRVEQQLVLRKGLFLLGREDDALRTLLQGALKLQPLE
jgi:hypothetical protein